MKLNDYQIWTRTTATYPPKNGVAYCLSGLAAEAGEVLGKYAKWLRGDTEALDIDAIAAELGDVLWFVARASDELGIDLDDIAIRNQDKLNSRKARGKLHGDGDDR